MKEWLCLVLLMLLAVLLKTTESEDVQKKHRSLSRKKRYLIFPDGSSLQLVYCLVLPSVGMGNIFTIGWTAAAAWELPHEPIRPFKKQEEAEKRVEKPGSSSSGGWKVQKGSSSTSYKTKKKPYYDSFSLKYPPSPYSTIKDSMKPGYSKIWYNGNPDTSYREHFKEKYVDYHPIYDALAIKPSFKSNYVMKEDVPFYERPVYNELHRRSRRDLFDKLEKFLKAQRQDGKACVLKAICEVSQTTSNTVGSFMEEMIKAIFRINPYKNADGQDEFDLAANESHNCTEKYSSCSSSVWSML